MMMFMMYVCAGLLGFVIGSIVSAHLLEEGKHVALAIFIVCLFILMWTM